MYDDSYYFNLIRHNIKRIREKEGLTQQQLADKTGITMNYLAKIESQKMQRVRTIVIAGRLANTLQVGIAKSFKPYENNK